MFGAGAHRTLLGLVLAVSLGTAGCADSDEPTTLPTLTPSPSESSSADASVSASPAKPASKKAEVEAAVRAYYTALNDAVATGDTSALRAASIGSCPCRQLVRVIEDAYSNGSLDGAHFSVESLTVSEVSENSASARVSVHSSDYAEVGPSGTVEKRFDAVNADVVFALVRVAAGWKISNENRLSWEPA